MDQELTDPENRYAETELEHRAIVLRTVDDTDPNIPVVIITHGTGVAVQPFEAGLSSQDIEWLPDDSVVDGRRVFTIGFHHFLANRFVGFLSPDQMDDVSEAIFDGLQLYTAE